MYGITRDRRQRLRAPRESFPPLLADFLERDVSDNAAWCAELLTGLDDAGAGRQFEAHGHRYALCATMDGVVIRNGIDRAMEPLRLAVTDVKRALSAWLHAIG